MASSSISRKNQDATWKNQFWNKTKNFAYKTPLYSLTLNGEIPTHLAQTLRDPWPGDGNLGQAIQRGEFLLNGKPCHFTPGLGYGNIWQQTLPDAAARELHGFEWLRHLHAMGGNQARQIARDIILEWKTKFYHFHDIAWHPVVMSERLTAWIAHFGFYGVSADVEFRHYFFAAISRQVRHLQRVLYKECTNSERLFALKGLLYAAFALPSDFIEKDKLLLILENELTEQLFADGFHVSRNPSLQFLLLRDLVEVRNLFLQTDQEPPQWLLDNIDLVAKALRIVRHGDNSLALFNGGFEENPTFLDLLMVSVNAKGRPMDALEDAGYYRLSAHRSLIVFNGGSRQAASDQVPESLFSFEFSVGKERLIVNCGAGSAISKEWEEAGETLPAHSALSPARLDKISYTPEIARHISIQRHQSEGNIWMEAEHGAFRDSRGFVYQRRLFLNAMGDDLRGEDILMRAGQETNAVPFLIRFHLHPKVQASMTQSGVLLRLPSGAGFRIRGSGEGIALEPSIYLGVKGTIQKTQQVVIKSELIGNEAQVKWAIQRESKK